MKPATSANSDTVYGMLDNFRGHGVLVSLVYANVKTNAKRKGFKTRTRYDFLKNGDTVSNCVKRLLNHYAKEGQPEIGIKGVIRICADIGWETWPARSFYTLISRLAAAHEV